MRKNFFHSAWARWLGCGLALELIAGCAGGSGGWTGGGGGGGNPTTVTFTVRGATPTAVAAKIGSGSYTAQTLSSGALTLSIPSGTSNFAVAVACPPLTITLAGVQIGSQTRQTVFQASTADGTSFDASCPQTPGTPTIQTGTLTGSVDASAIGGPLQQIAVLAANADAMLSTSFLSATPNFSFSAPAGSDRVEVLAYASSTPEVSSSSLVLAAKSFDNQQVPGVLNGGNAVVLGTADRTTSQSITYKFPTGVADPREMKRGASL